MSNALVLSSQAKTPVCELVSFDCISELRVGCATSLVSLDALGEGDIGDLAALMKGLTELFKLLEAEDFTRLFEWPGTIAWARDLYSETQAYIADRTEEKRSAVEKLIASGKLLLLGAALDGKIEVAFSPKIEVALPFHVPDSPWLVSGDRLPNGVITLAKADMNGLHLGDGSILAPGDGLEDAPGVKYSDGRTLSLSPAAMVTPWATMPYAIATLGFQGDYHKRHQGLLQETLEVIERHACGDYQILGDVMRVMGVKPVAPGRTLNASYSEFPGACVLSVMDHPYEMAANLIHELYHTLLSAYEAKGAVLAADQLVEDASERCYSPWRTDQRPPRGLLHALTVFEAVTAFWWDVLDSAPSQDRLMEYAQDQVARSVIQRNTGIASLLRVARLTDRGEAVVRLLREGVAADTARAAEYDLRTDGPSLEVWPDGTTRQEELVKGCGGLTLRESLFTHSSKYDPTGWSTKWMAARTWLFEGFKAD